MRAHILQHVPFEGLGSMEDWFREGDWTLTWSRLYAGDSLPQPEDFDFLVVLGGPMGVGDVDRIPWLRPEIDLLAQVLRRGTPLLGICLGAQLMAAALGAQVRKNREREIGWFPVELLREDALPLASGTPVFHWHGETFDLPAGGEWLARSAGCDHQAFRYGAAAVGLQFHLETTPEAADALLAHCAHELTPGTFVQSPQTIRAGTRLHAAAARESLGRLLDSIT